MNIFYKSLQICYNFFLKIGGAIGDCLTDQFSITSQGTGGTPIICGFNTGQHSKLNTIGHSHLKHYRDVVVK
jgi:hypothetical protein